MKTKILSFILIIALHRTPVTNAQHPHAHHQQEQTLTDKLAIPVIVITLAALLWATAPDDVKAACKDQLQPIALAFNLVHEHSSWSFAAFAHETGHAYATSLLTGQQGTIHIGAAAQNPIPKPLFRVGNIHVHGFSSNHAYTVLPYPDPADPTQADARINQFITDYCARHHINRHTLTHEQLLTMLTSPEGQSFRARVLSSNYGKHATILLAGGLTGLIAHHGSKGIWSYIHRLFRRTNRPLQGAWNDMIRPDSITFNQILNALIPFHASSDASKLWRDCVGVPQGVVNAIVKIAIFIDLAGEIFLAHRDYQNTPGAPMHSKVLIGLINNLTRGYLHIHA